MIKATLTPKPARRYFAIGVLVMLGLILVYLAFFTSSAAFGWTVVLVAMGVAALAMADRVRRATAMTIEMTETQIREVDGRVLCELAEIVRVERGLFAFKPSNGFLLVLSRKQSRVWSPGLWWRTGKRVGIGGATSAGEAKFMAEMIAMYLVERDGA